MALSRAIDIYIKAKSPCHLTQLPSSRFADQLFEAGDDGLPLRPKVHRRASSSVFLGMSRVIRIRED